MLYGPGGVFGPKGPFSTPAVRYPGGLEVTPVAAQNGQAKRPLSNSEMSSVGAEDMRSCKSQLVTNSVRQMGAGSAGGGGATSSGETTSSSKPPSRMDQYRASSRGVPEPPPLAPAKDKQMWMFEDKRQRMMAWINNNLNDEAPVAAGSFFTSDFVWWKVRQQRQHQAWDAGRQTCSRQIHK